MKQAEMRERIRDKETEFLKDLQRLMVIPSVKGRVEPNAPFGQACQEVLDTVLNLAASYGFQTKKISQAVGYAQWGVGDDYIGVVGHLDVVAAGEGWKFPPFQLSADNGRLYGRGILDNKGPIFACLYALKHIKDAGLSTKHPIRIIFGTDEESGSHDIPMYLAEEQPPLFGFTPDCKYPVVYGERGVVSYQIKTIINASLDAFSLIVGDQAGDHVPDELTLDYAGKILAVSGQRAPSNAPELGNNAIPLLARKILDQQPAPPVASYFQWLIDAFADKHHGEGLGMDFVDEESGQLIVTPYLLQREEAGFSLQLTIRYPVSYKEEAITEKLTRQLPKNSELAIIRSLKGHLFQGEPEAIKLLSNIYEELTGQDGTPVTTTGATYARSMPNIVAFGPSFPGQKGIAHNKNEYMDQSDLLLNMEIYLQAMFALANHTFEKEEDK